MTSTSLMRTSPLTRTPTSPQSSPLRDNPLQECQTPWRPQPSPKMSSKTSCQSVSFFNNSLPNLTRPQPKRLGNSTPRSTLPQKPGWTCEWTCRWFMRISQAIATMEFTQKIFIRDQVNKWPRLIFKRSRFKEEMDRVVMVQWSCHQLTLMVMLWCRRECQGSHRLY